MKQSLFYFFMICSLVAFTSCNSEKSSSKDDSETDPVKPKDPPKKAVFVETAELKKQRTALKVLWDKIMADYSPYPFGKKAEEDTGDIFTTKPSFQSPYQVAVHSEKFKTHALNWYNFYRTAARIPNVTIDADAQKRAEACATGSLALGVFRHGLTAAQRTTLTNHFNQNVSDWTHEGSNNSNLWTISGSDYKFHGSIEMNFNEGKLPDTGGKINFNVNVMGHRWWGLEARTKTIGFGFIGTNKAGPSANQSKTFACYKVTGSGVQKEPKQSTKFSAYPHGFFPIQADMKKVAHQGANFLKRKEQPISAHNWSRNHYTVWTLQNFNGYKIQAGKKVTVTIRKNAKNGEVIDQISTEWSRTQTARDDGALFRAHWGGARIHHIVIKPKHGIISGAFKAVQGNGGIRAFHITIAGEAITPSIQYHIVYYDLEHYQG